jgi:hypothetical protein
VIGIDDLDLDILAATIEVFRRHARGFDRAHAVGVLKDAGDVVEHADAHDAAGNLRMRKRCDAGQRKRAAEPEFLHDFPPLEIMVSGRFDRDGQTFETA